MSYARLALLSGRAALGCLFLAAGVGKFLWPTEFVAYLGSSRALASIGCDGVLLAYAIGAITGVLEVVLGGLLLLRGGRRCAMAAGVTFVLYSCFLVLDGRAECPCTWGAQVLGVSIGQKLLSNGLLATIALALVLGYRRRERDDAVEQVYSPQ